MVLVGVQAHQLLVVRRKDAAPHAGTFDDKAGEPLGLVVRPRRRQGQQQGQAAPTGEMRARHHGTSAYGAGGVRVKSVPMGTQGAFAFLPKRPTDR